MAYVPSCRFLYADDHIQSEFEQHRTALPARRQLTPGTPLTNGSATIQPPASGWRDDGRGLVGTRPKWSLIILAWLVPSAIAMLQATAGYALRGELGKDWPWVLMQFPRSMTWARSRPSSSLPLIDFRFDATPRGVGVDARADRDGHLGAHRGRVAAG